MSCGSADEQERNLNIVRASDPRRKRDEFQRFRAGLFLTPLTVAFRGIVVESKNTRFEWRACGSLDPVIFATARTGYRNRPPSNFLCAVADPWRIAEAIEREKERRRNSVANEISSRRAISIEYTHERNS